MVSCPKLVHIWQATLSILVRDLPANNRHHRHTILGKSQRKADQVNLEWEEARGIKAFGEVVCAACNDLLNSSAHTFIRARIWDDRIAGLRIWHPAYSAPSPCYHPTPTIPSQSVTTQFDISHSTGKGGEPPKSAKFEFEDFPSSSISIKMFAKTGLQCQAGPKGRQLEIKAWRATRPLV